MDVESEANAELVAFSELLEGLPLTVDQPRLKAWTHLKGKTGPVTRCREDTAQVTESGYLIMVEIEGREWAFDPRELRVSENFRK